MFLFGIRRDSSRDQPHACASRPTVSLSVSSISSPDDLSHSPVLPHSSHLSSLFAVPSGTLVQPCYTLLSLLVARPASASSSRSLFLFLSLSLSAQVLPLSSLTPRGYDASSTLTTMTTLTTTTNTLIFAPVSSSR